MPGSGKSTIAASLIKEFNLKHYNMGQMWRDIAKKKGVNVTIGQEQAEDNPVTDNDIDNYQKELGEKEDNFLIEGRISWHFIPKSIKLFIDCDINEGAKRIFNDIVEGIGRDEGEAKDIDEMKEWIQRRMNSEKKRYKKFYSIDAYDKNNYDIIIDTTNLNIEEAIRTTIKKINERIK